MHPQTIFTLALLTMTAIMALAKFAVS